LLKVGVWLWMVAMVVAHIVNWVHIRSAHSLLAESEKHIDAGEGPMKGAKSALIMQQALAYYQCSKVRGRR
jgi:hypothetical protein